MSFKRAQVVMLPTNEKANINSIIKRKHRLNQEHLSLICREDNQSSGFKQWCSGGDLITLNHVILTNENWPETSFQHLYFLSDYEEIKYGDYIGYTNLKTWCPVQYLGGDLTGNERKIIATTDGSLGLPKPSISFINKFIKSYNNNNPIERVNVEYDEYATVKQETKWKYAGLTLKVDSVYVKDRADGFGRNLRLSLIGTPFEETYEFLGEKRYKDTVIWENDLIISYKLKVSNENEITIRKIKDKWDRQEHEQSLRDLAQAISNKHRFGDGIFDIDKWIIDNVN